MPTLTEHLQILEARAKGAPTHLRRHTRQGHGHQGDVYVHPIAARPHPWDVRNDAQSTQVATGDSVGARHCASGPLRIWWPRSATEAADACPFPVFLDNLEMRRECLGPVIEAEGEWTLTHPEHDHHVFPAGIYLVTYQVDVRTARRVVD